MGLLVVVAGMFFAWKLANSPGDAILDALRSHTEATPVEGSGSGLRSLLAILAENYEDTRTNATQWASGPRL